MIEIQGQPIATENSIKIRVTSTGGDLTDWQYNLYWGNPDKWVDCDIIPHLPDPSEINITENVAMCTEYGISVRAKDSNGKYVTSEGFTYVKTKGHAVVTWVSDFVIGDDNPEIRWKWNIYNKEYSYRISILNANDDVIINLADDKKVDGIGPNLEDLVTLQADQMNGLYAAGTGEFTFWVATKDANGNYLEAVGIPFVVRLTENENKLKPEFTDYMITAPAEILKGYSIVTVDYRLQAGTSYGAKGRYGASITQFITVVEGFDHHVEDEYCEGIVEFIPKLSGSVGITVTALDSRGYSTEVTKRIDVIDYSPIEIHSATAGRGNPTNVINLELQGKWSNRPSIEHPTIKYNYRLPSGVWKKEEDVEITTQCAVDGSNFSYEGKAFELDTGEISNTQDLIVKFVVSDNVTEVEFELYIPSASIISITGEKQGNLPIGRIKLNGQGIMGYIKQVDNLNDVFEAGIYSILSSPQAPAAGLPASLDVGGFLEVIACGLFVMQRATLYNASNVHDIHTYIRFYVNTDFSNWREI